MSDNKKKLLNESTVRRFMGLAGIGALSNKFVDDKQLNEETMEVEVPDVTPSAPLDLEEQEMAPPAVADEGEPMGMEGEPEDADEFPDIDLSAEEAQLLIDLGKKLEGEMPEEDPAMEAPPEDMDMGMPPEEMPPEEMPPMPMQERLVRELTSRVARRVKKEYVVSEVMKRVASRLKNSSE